MALASATFSMSFAGSKIKHREVCVRSMSQQSDDAIEIARRPSAKRFPDGPWRAIGRSCEEGPKLHPVIYHVERHEVPEAFVSSDASEIALDEHASQWWLGIEIAAGLSDDVQRAIAELRFVEIEETRDVPDIVNLGKAEIVELVVAMNVCVGPLAGGASPEYGGLDPLHFVRRQHAVPFSADNAIALFVDHMLRVATGKGRKLDRIDVEVAREGGGELLHFGQH